MYEYAITAGEGTLIDYGMSEDLDAPLWFQHNTENSDYRPDDQIVLLIAVMGDDCETGK